MAVAGVALAGLGAGTEVQWILFDDSTSCHAVISITLAWDFVSAPIRKDAAQMRLTVVMINT